MATYRHIVAAADATDDRETVIQHAVELSKALGAKLDLIQILEHLPATLPVDIIPPEGVADKVEWIREYSEAELKKTAARCGANGAEIHAIVGKFGDEISQYAKDHHADLLVMGAHRHRGLNQLKPSKSDRMAHMGACDVLAVHI